MFEWITSNLLWTQGIVLVGVFAVLGVLCFWFFRYGLFLIGVLFLFSVFFFRNPDRVCKEFQTNNSVLICPADGWIVGIDSESTHDLDGFKKRVSIFLTPFDVHVNWLPCAGVVENIIYYPGEFSFAFLPKSSDKNERNDVLVKTSNGREIKIRQIAGTIARKIVCWVVPEQQVDAGQKFGMIKFGSRVDVFLPEKVEIAVKKGQHVYGGQTVLGYWK